MSNQEQGLSLDDLAPAKEKVFISDDKFVWVQGWSYAVISDMLKRFPILAKWVMGRGFQLSDLATASPDVIAAAIAAALGKPGDEAAEKKAGDLAMETQLNILEAAGKITFKSGFGPFVDRIAALADALLSVSSGRGQDTNSQQTSKPSLQTDTPPPSPGV